MPAQLQVRPLGCGCVESEEDRRPLLHQEPVYVFDLGPAGQLRCRLRATRTNDFAWSVRKWLWPTDKLRELLRLARHVNATVVSWRSESVAVACEIFRGLRVLPGDEWASAHLFQGDSAERDEMGRTRRILLSVLIGAPEGKRPGGRG